MLTAGESGLTAGTSARDLASRLSPTLCAAMNRVRTAVLAAPPPDAPVVPAALATLPGVRRVNVAGPVHIHRTVLPRGSLHGAVTVAVDGLTAPHVASAAGRDARLADTDPQGWLYIDTETTSLHAGAGVWVFMMGMGWFEGDAFIVEQALLCGPESEHSWFDAWLPRVRAASALVSFHGKCFDAPRLDDRLRLAGREPACVGRPHFDLIYPTRRIAAGGWPDCRLRTVEQRLLGFERHDDLPGALCPAAWFAWLRDQPNGLADVFEHNRLDIVSLAGLAGELTRQYRGASAGRAAVATGLDWWRAGHRDRAVSDWRRATAGPGPFPALASLRAARALRRSGERQLAAELSVLAGIPVPGRRRAVRAEGCSGGPCVSPARTGLAPKNILAQTLKNLRTGQTTSARCSEAPE